MSHAVHTVISPDVLDPLGICAAVEDARCGAVVSFLGVVRDHDAGLDITSIDYSAHPRSSAILQDIAENIVRRQGVHRVEAWHRLGHLTVGEAALVVAVGAEHRDQAFAAAAALVDEIKTRLPVWKSQELSDGYHVWSGLS